MAAPNMLALSAVNIHTAILDASSTETDLIAAVTSGHSVVVDLILISNVNTSGVTGEVTVIYKRSGTDHTICYKYKVPSKNMVNVLLGKSLTVEEGDSIRIIAGPGSPATGILTAFASYSDCAP